MIKKMMMIIVIKVEADVRGHPQDTKKVSVILNWSWPLLGM